MYLRPKLKITKKLNEEIQEENEKLYRQNDSLKIEYKTLQESIEENQKTAQFWVDYLTKSQEEALSLSKTYKDKCMEATKEQIERETQRLQEEYDLAAADYKQEYLETLQDAVNDFQTTMDEKQKLKAELDRQIADKTSAVYALIEEAKRHFEEEHKQDFYRLCLSNDDIADVYELRRIVPHLKKSEPLNKVIWKSYYEKPYTDLIGRVIGTGVHTGIYKITNIDNQMCYVGQAVNIAERWKTHIKRGLGAEVPINNKLYPAMASYGPENFTFEIIEECERNKLNEREDYWQEVFKAKEFGYSIK